LNSNWQGAIRQQIMGVFGAQRIGGALFFVPSRVKSAQNVDACGGRPGQEQGGRGMAEAGLQEEIDEVLVPTEEVIEVRRGKKVTSERRFMPGYVLVRMEMSSKGYHLISQINRVTGFLGPQGKPMPMRDAEVNGILNRVEEGEAAPRNLIRFDIGEKVKVTDGPFEGFDGMVEDVDEAHNRLKVSVSIFGRATPVELEFTQVSKGI
jgi:transcription termination/antitermination protein NusG